MSPMTSPVTRVVGGVPPGSPFHAARGVGIWEQMDKPILPEDMKRVIREKTLLGMASGLDIAKHALRGAELWNTVRKHRSILGAAWREFSPKKGNMREGFLSDYVDSKIYPEFRRMKAFEANFFDTLDRMTPTQLPEQPTGVTLGSFIKGMMQK